MTGKGSIDEACLVIRTAGKKPGQDVIGQLPTLWAVPVGFF